MSPTFAAILDAACQQFEVTRAEVLGPSRLARIVDARSATAWAARRRMRRGSYQEIGHLLGGRHHTTIMLSVRRADAVRGKDDGYRRATDALLAVSPVAPRPAHMWEIPA